MNPTNQVTKEQFKQMFDYAKANPTENSSKVFAHQLQSGVYNQFGSVNKTPAPTESTPAPEEKSVASSYLPEEGVFHNQAALSHEGGGQLAEKVADFTGGKKLAQGLGQAIALPGSEKVLDKSMNDAIDQQTELLKKRKEIRDLGGDLTHIDRALEMNAQNLKQMGSGADKLLNPNELTDKGVIGSSLQLASNFIPTEAIAGTLAGKTGSALAGKVLAGAGTGYALDVANKLQDKNRTSGTYTPGLGTAIGAGLPIVGKIIGEVSKRISGFLSGTGTDAIQKAIDNPDEVNAAINKYAKTPEAKRTLVDNAKDAIQKFTTGKQQEYGKAIESLAPTEGVELSKQAAVDGFKEGLNKFDVKLTPKGELNFASSALTDVDEANIEKAWNKINDWTDESPKGLDKLRQAIGNFAKDFRMAGNPRANVILDDAASSLKQHLTESLPGYSDILSTYGEKSDLTNEVLKELQLGGTAKPSTQLKNIMNLFKKEPELRQKIVDIMGEGEANKFMNDLSGAVFSNWLPEVKGFNAAGRLATEGAGATGAFVAGGTGAGIPAIVGGALASSPRIVGKTAVLAGKVAKTGLPKIIRRAATMGAANTEK